MELEIAYLPDGSVRVRIPDGQAGITFEQAKARVLAFQRELGIAGLPIRFVGEIERHTHGPDEAHVHGHQRAHTH